MSTAPEERFHINVVALGDLIQDLISDAFNKGFTSVNPTMAKFACTILASFDKIKVIENFIEYSYVHWDKVKEKKEVFFTEHAGDIFRDLPLNNVNSFKDLFTMKDKDGLDVIKKDDRDAIWEFFFSLIKISIHYAHEIKNPIVVISKDGKKTPAYSNTNKFKNLDVIAEANKWGVTLKFKV